MLRKNIAFQEKLFFSTINSLTMRSISSLISYETAKKDTEKIVTASAMMIGAE
jgi:hypothetical protein